MKFTRRHARALAAGAGTTLAYLAASKVGPRQVRGGALFLLAATALATAQASAKAKNTSDRLDAHISATAAAVALANGGGTISGSLTVTGGLNTSGSAINTSGGNISMGAGDLSCQDVNSSGTCTLTHILMSGGNINMGGNNCNNSSAYVVAGAPHRANLGTVAFNAAGVQSVADRCDFILNTAGTGAGWAS